MVFLLTWFSSQHSFSQTAQSRLGIEEHLGAKLPLDLEFYDEKGFLVPLRSIVNKPTVVTFVYYRCPSVCSPLLTEVSHVIDRMGLEIGKEYQVLTISFNHHETPALSSEKKASYLNILNSPIDESGWRFMTGDSANIATLTSAAGFFFQHTGNDFVHPAALIVISADGKIARYIYGAQYLPFDVKMALAEASQGRTGPTIAKVLNFCYSYDPESHAYALNVTRISGIIVVGLAGLFVFVFIVRPGRRSKESPAKA